MNTYIIPDHAVTIMRNMPAWRHWIVWPLLSQILNYVCYYWIATISDVRCVWGRGWNISLSRSRSLFLSRFFFISPSFFLSLFLLFSTCQALCCAGKPYRSVISRATRFRGNVTMLRHLYLVTFACKYVYLNTKEIMNVYLNTKLWINITQLDFLLVFYCTGDFWTVITLFVRRIFHFELTLSKKGL